VLLPHPRAAFRMPRVRGLPTRNGGNRGPCLRAEQRDLNGTGSRGSVARWDMAKPTRLICDGSDVTKQSDKFRIADDQ
jgi:hypothetical protein